MSNVVLASGQITPADQLSIELVQAAETPAVVLIRWPDAPSVLNPDPRTVAAVAASVVRLLAEAQTRLATVIRSR